MAANRRGLRSWWRWSASRSSPIPCEHVASPASRPDPQRQGRRHLPPGIKAIVVYPVNALANSQLRELEKFLKIRYPQGPPVTFDRYTGQESAKDRARIIADPPDVLLTNYVMLELVLTRPRDRGLIDAAQGPAVPRPRRAAYVSRPPGRGRRAASPAAPGRACSAPDVQCIGTSATMTTEGDTDDQRRVVAEMATTLFGVTVQPGHVIGETLERITDPAAASAAALRSRIAGTEPPPAVDIGAARPEPDERPSGRQDARAPLPSCACRLCPVVARPSPRPRSAPLAGRAPRFAA